MVVLKGRVMVVVVVVVVGCDGPGRFEWRSGYVWTCFSKWNTHGGCGWGNTRWMRVRKPVRWALSMEGAEE